MYKYIKKIIFRIIKINDSERKKIFCISSQRTGTTSTGKFLKDHGYRVATYFKSKSNNWTYHWFKGNYNTIFDSFDFKYYQAFEDDPWWCTDFYQEIYRRYSNASFIFFTRDSNKWFDSMVSHSTGKTLGNTEIHAYIYNRVAEYKKLGLKETKGEIDNLLDLSEKNRVHYISIYDKRNREVIKFFEGKSNFIHIELEDKNKWQKLGDFLELEVNEDYSSYENRSIKTN